MYFGEDVDGPHAVFDSARRRWYSFRELREEVTRLAGAFDSPNKLVIFCFCRNDFASLTWYLAALHSAHAVALLDSALEPEFKQRLIEIYRPEFVVSSAELAELDGRHEVIGTANHLWRRSRTEAPPLHADLKVLLSTSGSTGSPKFVRLTAGNLWCNARSICRALDISAEDRAISSLPLHYSYGLSVFNTHLLAGASLVLTNEGLLSPRFWPVFREQQCTTFAGVPYSYEILQRLNVDRLNVPSLHTMTQAGGKLADDLVATFHETMARRGGRFFVMYGQTEAVARIAILPSEGLPAKLGSAGRAIPGGSIAVNAGELVYTGPNVMMGYASSREDLALGDALNGTLHTGDSAHLDADGYVYIDGRLKRDAKLFGLRLNLDEIETMLRAHGPTAVVDGNGTLRIFCEYGDDRTFEALRIELAARLHLHHDALSFERVQHLPLNGSGKVDYQALGARR